MDHIFSLNTAEAVLREISKSLTPEGLIGNKISRRGKTLIYGDFRLDLSRFSKIGITGGGKAAAGMAHALNEMIPEICCGILCGSNMSSAGNIEVFPCGHPLPDSSSFDFTRKSLDLIRNCDLVIAAVSGGASSMFELPEPGISEKDLISAYKCLLFSGMSIEQINVLRGKLSCVKSGKLLSSFPDINFLGILLSDIPGGDPCFIGSGPTFVTEYDAMSSVFFPADMPSSVIPYLKDNKKIPRQLNLLENLVISENRDAVLLTAAVLEKTGYSVSVSETALRNSADTAANTLLSAASTCATDLFVCGGEITTVKTGNGSGGRIQELALRILSDLDQNQFFCGIATDGRDGITKDPVSAVFVHGGLNIPENEISSALENSDSYPLLKRHGCILHSGLTGTNLADVYIMGGFC